MNPILEGTSGDAVEDIQDRLKHLGYQIDDEECDERHFGPSTANAVAKFRIEHDLPLGQAVDTQTWAALVDECYEMGDRTLYLRLPNFHGNDVRELQNALNILGFSCGEADGFFGAHTDVKPILGAQRITRAVHGDCARAANVDHAQFAPFQKAARVQRLAGGQRKRRFHGSKT